MKHLNTFSPVIFDIIAIFFGGVFAVIFIVALLVLWAAGAIADAIGKKRLTNEVVTTDHFPLTSTMQHILLTLAKQQPHQWMSGAEIQRENTAVSVSTLYSDIAFLLKQGLIERTLEAGKSHPT